MKFALCAPIVFFSFVGLAESKWPEEMPQSCVDAISRLPDVREGSVSSSQQDIIDGLKYDWMTNPVHFKAVFSDCGSSDFFYIEVDKASCKVIDVGSGDSDGECEL